MTIIHRSPRVFAISIIFCVFLLYSTIVFLFTSTRLLAIKRSFHQICSEVIRGWLWLESSVTRQVFGGVLLLLMRVSLFPAATIPFHFPVWRISLSISIWLVILMRSISFRRLQWKIEFFADASLSSFWACFAIIVETIRRGARAFTLGARIGVNIIVGGILHRIIGETTTIWGITVFCLFELMVVFVQVYVLILLTNSYWTELWREILVF